MHITNHRDKRRERLADLVLILIFLTLGAAAVVRAPYATGLIVTATIIGCTVITIGHGVTNRVYDISTKGVTVTWYGRFSRQYRWDMFSEIGIYLVTGPYGMREYWLICSEIPIKKDEAGHVSSNWVCVHPMKVLYFTNLTIEQEKQFYSFIPRS